LANTTSLQWSVTSKEWGNIFSSEIGLVHHLALVGDNLAVGPVSALKLGEDELALEADLKGTNPWHLLEVWHGLVFVWH
jgi:hypothetical protein